MQRPAAAPLRPQSFKPSRPPPKAPPAPASSPAAPPTAPLAAAPRRPAKPPPKPAAMKPNGKMPPLAGKGNVAVGSEASEVTQAEASNRQPVVEVASVPRPEEQRKVQERDSSNEETEGSAGATISRARQRTAVAPPPVPAPPVTANLAVNFEKATADYDFEATEPDWQLSVRGGDVMNVVEKRDDGWWTVQVLEGPSKGQQGDVPSAYLSIVRSARLQRTFSEAFESQV